MGRVAQARRRAARRVRRRDRRRRRRTRAAAARLRLRRVRPLGRGADRRPGDLRRRRRRPGAATARTPHERTTRLAARTATRGSWRCSTAAGDAGLPVLGVCRGMQLMAVAAGGSLDQHTPDVVGHDEHSPGGDAFGAVAVRTARARRVARPRATSVAGALPPPPVGPRAPRLRGHRVGRRRDRRGDGGRRRALLRRRPVAPGDRRDQACWSRWSGRRRQFATARTDGTSG